MNRSQRIHDKMYLLQEETPTPPTPESQPERPPTLVHLYTDSRKRKRSEFETTLCMNHQYMIYSSPVINVA